MARMHCRYCEGEFNSLRAYDRHLILYPDVEHPPWNAYNGRPVCEGVRGGKPFIDPEVAIALERGREQAARNLSSGPPPSSPKATPAQEGIS